MKPSSLPIDSLLASIVETVRQYPITLLEAEPGAGKTTRVPPALLDAGLANVYVLEPRRIAARMAARRVAAERNEQVGQSIGYEVRFEQETGPHTKLSFCTGGILTRKLLEPPHLDCAQVVVLDEFHERQLESDLALALLRRMQHTRPGLRILLMSATLGGEMLQEHLGDAPVIRSPGRMFPIETKYTAASSTALAEQVNGALEPALRDSEGDVLIFLPGAAEIRAAMRTSEGLGRRFNTLLLPLHGDLSIEEQDRAVNPCSQRKAIFSTNVAESSITIHGVRVVIDSGLARINSWSPWNGLSRLRVEKVNRSSAIQRAGRAGRTARGLAIRLYSEEDFRRRPEHTVPEILRADLASTLLEVSASGIAIEDLPWLSAPGVNAVLHARNLLVRLGALTTNHAVTPVGKRLARIPVHPRLARFVFAASKLGSSTEAAEIAARLSESRLRIGERHRKGFASDVEAMLASELAPHIKRSMQQIVQRLPRVAHGAVDPHAVEKSLLIGYPDRVARRRGDNLLLSGGGSARLDRASAVHSEFLAAIEIEDRAEQGTPLVRIASPIEPDWLLELFPDHVTTRDALEWNREAERVEHVSSLLYDALVIDESRQMPAGKSAAELLAAKAIEAGVEQFVDRTSLEQLLARVRLAAKHSPGLTLPEAFVEQALRQLATGIRSFAELHQAAGNGGLEKTIMAILPMEVIDEFAPTHVRLPSGRRAPIVYSEHQPPWVGSRLQDFFGMRTTPTVARGEVPLVIHLLAPNQRPVQMTQDLSSFWKNLYPTVRRELSRKYPKHKWPEDPLSVLRD